MRKLVVFLSFIASTFAVDMPKNLAEGKALAELAQAKNRNGVESEGRTFRNFTEMDTRVSEYPKEAGFSTFKLKEESKKKQATDETYQIIADNQEHRNYQGFTENGVESFLDAQGKAIGEPKNKIIEEYRWVECQEPGDLHTLSCQRTRNVLVNVIPEVTRVEKSCPGHKKKSWFSGTRFCEPRECQSKTVVDRPKQVVIAHDDWQGCEEIEKLHDEGLCELTREVLGDFNQTRVRSGENITRDYWETTRIYQCGFPDDSKDSCSHMDLEGCAKVSRECTTVLDIGRTRVCKVYTNTYRCPLKKILLPSLVPGQQGFCLSGDCLPTQRSSNNQIFNALSKLEILRQMQKQIASVGTIQIFKGETQSCTTNFGGGFKDCCKGMRGFGLSLKLARACSADEHALADARAQGRAVPIGSYVKNKHLGINFSKAQVFCTFPTKIARIFQVEARKQLRLGWGEAKSPNCRGLSVEELQRLDFSRMDLSELYTELSSRIKKSSAIMKSVMANKQDDFRGKSKDVIEKPYKERQIAIDKGVQLDKVY